MNYLGAQPTGIMAAMPMPAQAAVGQFAITDPDSPMGIQSLVGGQEELAERLRAMGVPKYGIGKYFRKFIPKEVRKVASVVVPTALVMMGQPHLAAAYSGITTKLEGGSTKDALINAGTAYLASKLPGAQAGTVTPGYIASVAALQTGAAKLKGADTKDALKQGVISAATAGALKGFAGTETGQQVFGKIGEFGNAITPDFLKAAQPSTAGLDNLISTGDIPLETDSLLSDLATPLNVTAPSTSLTGNVADNLIQSLNVQAPVPSANIPAVPQGGFLTDANLGDVVSGLSPVEISPISTLSDSSALSGLDNIGLDNIDVGNVGIGERIQVVPKVQQSIAPKVRLMDIPTGEELVAAATPEYTGGGGPTLGEVIAEGGAEPTFFERLKDEFSVMGKNLTFGGKEPVKDFLRSAVLPAGGIALLAGLGMDEPGMEGGSPFTEEQAAAVASYLAGTGSDPIYGQRAQTFADFYNQRRRAMGLNEGGEIVGPGTGTSDSVPALLSDGEFVMTAKAVRNAGGGNREKGAAKMYALMNKLEQGAA